VTDLAQLGIGRRSFLHLDAKGERVTDEEEFHRPWNVVP
jgi:hypothetical protein